MKNNLIATEIHYSTLCYVVICYRDKKPSLFLLNVDGRSHGHIFLFWNFNQSFIYHGWTLNLDKVFGWWSYFFNQTIAQISCILVYALFVPSNKIENSRLNYSLIIRYIVLVLTPVHAHSRNQNYQICM